MTPSQDARRALPLHDPAPSAVRSAAACSTIGAMLGHPRPHSPARALAALAVAATLTASPADASGEDPGAPRLGEDAHLVPARYFYGRVYNRSSETLEAWASGVGRFNIPPKTTTGAVDVDHVKVCGQWYKIRFDGWIRVYDGCKLGVGGTQCKADGPGKPCA